ncbi:hypothetical protein TNCV_3223131 [Trichonephila clavipes]|nr:hypothetical protein TNCV_3223131 [Trichonephila clavipes]
MMKWKDKRNVNLLTNFHNPRSTTDVIRKEKYGSRTSVPGPLALSDYNRQMNCVDRFDQLKSAEVHEQMSRSGSQSEAKPLVFSPQASLVLIYRPTEGVKV